MSWTDDRVEVLRNMWGAGKSASEIAEELGGVTRNAVIGKAHRLGLSGRPSPIQRKKKVKAEEKTIKKGATILELNERMCKWPIGDPRNKDFHFCGCGSMPGLPYCAEHAAKAYQQSSKQRNLLDEVAEMEKKERQKNQSNNS